MTSTSNLDGTVSTRRPVAGVRRLGSIRQEWWLQGLIAAIVVAYGVSTLVVHRPPSGYNTFWDGWVQNIASALPVIPLLLRARRSPRVALGLAGHGGRGHAVHAGGSRVHLSRPEPQAHPQPGPE